MARARMLHSASDTRTKAEATCLIGDAAAATTSLRSFQVLASLYSHMEAYMVGRRSLPVRVVKWASPAHFCENLPAETD